MKDQVVAGFDNLLSLSNDEFLFLRVFLRRYLSFLRCEVGHRDSQQNAGHPSAETHITQISLKCPDSINPRVSNAAEAANPACSNTISTA